MSSINAYTLGISYGFHDASAALVGDGKLLAASSEERFSRQKHDPNFPTHAVRHCLETAGIGIQRLSRIAYHENPGDTFTRVFASGLAGYPGSRKEFVAGTSAWLGKKLWVQNDISKRLDVHPQNIVYLNHHQAHAAQAFLGSGFDEAAVLIVDAVGEWSTTSFFQASRRDPEPSFKTIGEVRFPHSLGLVYSAFTAFLGFVPMDGECSTMALAAFGTPRYADKVREIVRMEQDGTFQVDQSYFNFMDFYRDAWTDKFLGVFGRPRTHKENLPFDCLSRTVAASDDARRWADVAASVQLVVEEAMLRMAARLRAATGSSKLCLGGGVALNCVANGRLIKESGFTDIYIPPDPGDGGAAVGAALFAGMSGAAPKGGSPRPAYHPYVGGSYDERRDAEILPYARPARYRRFAKSGHEPRSGETWDHRLYEDFDALVRDAAAALQRGNIVAWCQERFENGPRALGHRSLLIRPDDPELARRLSLRVKDRAAYRPYALSMTEEHAFRILDLDRQAPIPRLYRWMQASCPVREDMIAKVRSAVHVDGTTRPQVCGARDSARFYRLLQEIGKASGVEAVLNTSFNEAGVPLVSSPIDALAVFARADIDVLVFNNLMVKKVYAY